MASARRIKWTRRLFHAQAGAGGPASSPASRLHHGRDQGKWPKTHVGDTIDRRPQARKKRCRASKPAMQSCSVACSLPMRPSFEDLREALSRLHLTTPASPTRPKHPLRWASDFAAGSSALAPGDHPRAAGARFDLDLIATAPSRDLSHHPRPTARRSSCTIRPTCRRRAHLQVDEAVDQSDDLPCPDEHLGSVLKLCEDRRGSQIELTYGRQPRPGGVPATPQRSGVRFLRPAEIGFPAAISFDYHVRAIHEGDLVKMSILVTTSRWTPSR